MTSSPGCSVTGVRARGFPSSTHTSRDSFSRPARACLYFAGPGHGGPALVAAGWLEGTYSEIYPHVSQDVEGMRRLFRQFSSPGGVPSHVSVPTPGSIHEGGELGYVLVHAFGAVMDNPDLLAIAVVGDGEAETGPLEGSWKGISFLDPTHDGAVLPILHLNDAKISGPTILGRKPPEEVRALLSGHGYQVIEVTGDDLPGMHERFAQALADAYSRIRDIQTEAREGRWRRVAADLAIVGLTDAQRMDRPRDDRRGKGRRDLPFSPGAAGGGEERPRPPSPAGELAPLVPSRGALRR